MPALVVAQIEKDYISEDGLPEFQCEGKEFHYGAMLDWWGWDDVPSYEEVSAAKKARFKMYDDDGELYYEGWLLNDDRCMVQQFVLKWGESFAGCTTITVYKDEEAGYVQEIG